jgi:hypothetical protein
MRPTLLALAVVLLAGCATQGVEEPSYALQMSEGDFEVRTYAPTIVAVTTVQGDAWSTRFEGFGPLADYIFAKGREGETIAMTAPVTQAPREKISMTAPLTQAESTSGAWTIGFTMPAGYTIESLPAPVSPDVKLVEQSARTMAVYSFSGVASDRDMEEARHTLLARTAAAGLTPKGDAVFAFYDPPWTLAFFRRNEVMVEVAQSN